MRMEDKSLRIFAFLDEKALFITKKGRFIT